MQPVLQPILFGGVTLAAMVVSSLDAMFVQLIQQEDIFGGCVTAHGPGFWLHVRITPSHMSGTPTRAETEREMRRSIRDLKKEVADLRESHCAFEAVVSRALVSVMGKWSADDPDTTNTGIETIYDRIYELERKVFPVKHLYS